MLENFLAAKSIYEGSSTCQWMWLDKEWCRALGAGGFSGEQYQCLTRRRPSSRIEFPSSHFSSGATLSKVSILSAIDGGKSKRWEVKNRGHTALIEDEDIIFG